MRLCLGSSSAFALLAACSTPPAASGTAPTMTEPPALATPALAVATAPAALAPSASAVASSAPASDPPRPPLPEECSGADLDLDRLLESKGMRPQVEGGKVVRSVSGGACAAALKDGWLTTGTPTIRVRPRKESFPVGTEILLDVVLENPGDTPMTLVFSGCDSERDKRASRLFHTIAFNAQGDLADDVTSGIACDGLCMGTLDVVTIAPRGRARATARHDGKVVRTDSNCVVKPVGKLGSGVYELRTHVALQRTGGAPPPIATPVTLGK